MATEILETGAVGGGGGRGYINATLARGRGYTDATLSAPD